MFTTPPTLWSAAGAAGTFRCKVGLGECHVLVAAGLGGEPLHVCSESLAGWLCVDRGQDRCSPLGGTTRARACPKASTRPTLAATRVLAFGRNQGVSEGEALPPVATRAPPPVAQK